MIKKPTQKQLKAQIVELSIAHLRAHLAVQRRRAELNDEYRKYFSVHGEPEPNFRGIRWDDPRYQGVIGHTNESYDRLRVAKQKRYSAKRRLDTAVRRLMVLSGTSFTVPTEPAVSRKAAQPVRRFTAAGETLQ